jgi:RNA polymerase sigma-70 factor (ECF subfamily)
VDTPVPNRLPSPVPVDRSRWFVELLGTSERQLNAFVLALVPSWPDADEVVQQTRIRLWEQFDRYDPTLDFAAWARAIAYYQVLTYRKQAGRRGALLSDAVLEQLAADADRLDDLAPRKEALNECLKKLTPPQRALLAQCYGGSASIREVSEDLGRSFTAVRQSLFRLRQLLYRCIQQRLLEESGA